MKKLIPILAFAILSVNAFAFPNISIVNSSFNNSVPVPHNSPQWVDAKYVSGSWTSSDSVKIIIEHIDPVYGAINAKIIFRIRYWDTFVNTPTNPDGSTRLYFNMPDNAYPSEEFRMSIAFYTFQYGLLENCISISNAGADVSFCSGDSAPLGTALTANYTYSWLPITGLNSSTVSDPTVTLTNTGTTPVTYTYTVTSTLNGCSTQDAVLVTVNPLPISNAGTDVSFSSGNSATLGTTLTANYTYSWLPITGLNSSTVSNPTVTLTNTGATPVTYTYTVTSTLNGCSTQDSVLVTVNPSALSIFENTILFKEQNSVYYNSLGQQVVPSTGFYIQQTGTKAKKIYIIN